jgi:hypothetical protein
LFLESDLVIQIPCIMVMLMMISSNIPLSASEHPGLDVLLVLEVLFEHRDLQGRVPGTGSQGHLAHAALVRGTELVHFSVIFLLHELRVSIALMRCLLMLFDLEMVAI